MAVFLRLVFKVTGMHKGGIKNKNSDRGKHDDEKHRIGRWVIPKVIIK
jgi:hypothetical protein